MDPLSVTAGIIAVLQLSTKVISYLSDVKDAPKDRAHYAIKLSNLHSLLLNLRFRLEEGDTSQPWYNAIRALTVGNRPLDQFKQALETLQAKMITDGGRLELTKGETADIINIILRSVGEAYRAHPQQKSECRKSEELLHIILAAVRPLTVAEVNPAMDIEERHTSFEGLKFRNRRLLRMRSRIFVAPL